MIIMQNGDKQNKHQQLLELVRKTIQLDAELREKLKIGERFRFIRDRLHVLLVHAEEHAAEQSKKSEKKKSTLSENEILVYVHLFNSQGMMLPTWQKMLVPSVFYDHSVNRPIYPDKENIEAFIRSKTNKAQHAFLVVAVAKDVIMKTDDAAPKDGLGHALIKVKEGSLKFNRLISFTHNGHEYTVNENGELKKRDNNH